MVWGQRINNDISSLGALIDDKFPHELKHILVELMNEIKEIKETQNKLMVLLEKKNIV